MHNSLSFVNSLATTGWCTQNKLDQGPYIPCYV